MKIPFFLILLSIAAVSCGPDIDLSGDAAADAASDESVIDEPEEESTSLPCAGLRKLGEDVRVGSEPETQVFPSLVWTGSEYAVAAVGFASGDTGGNILLARISADGAVVVSDIQVSSSGGGTCAFNDLAWTGSELGAAWSMNVEPDESAFDIFFARLSPAGEKIGADTMIRHDSMFSSMRVSLAWTGMEFGAVWEDERHILDELYFTRVSPQGEQQGGETRLTESDAPSRDPSLAWTGSQYGVAWTDAAELLHVDSIFFMRLAPDGTKLEEEQIIGRGVGHGTATPDLAWSGSEFAVAWERHGEGLADDIMITRLTDHSAILGDPIMVTDNGTPKEFPSLAWAGSMPAVAWDAYEDGISAIHLAIVSTDSESIGPTLRITNGEGYAQMPSLAWSGSELGVAWHDDRDGAQRVYFARVGCL